MGPNLEDRVVRLERDMRRVRIVLLLVLIVAAGMLLATVLPRGRAEAVTVFAATALLLAAAETAVYVWRRGAGVPDVVRAKKFEVVDERGHIFVEIGETTDGRGAVVTHDGDSHVILTPAHPPVERRVSKRPSDAPAGGAQHAEEGAMGAAKASHVDVKLIYRGDGVYEAKITEGAEHEEAEEPPSAEPAAAARDGTDDDPEDPHGSGPLRARSASRSRNGD